MTMNGPWGLVTRDMRLLGQAHVWRKAMDSAMAKEAHRLRGIMVESFGKGGPPGGRWRRLSTFTQLVSRALGKDDRKPLMDNGDLRNSHTVVKEGDAWFAGVHRSAKGKKSGKGLVNLALVHEYGAGPYGIHVTDKMRRFFFWLYKETGGQIMPLSPRTQIIVVQIPARPWIGPIWEQEKDQAANNVMRDTITNFRMDMAAFGGLG